MSDRTDEVIAVASSYDELVAAMVARRQELGLSQLAIDEIAGLQTGYTGKIEIQTKRMGVMSLTSLLGALGLELRIVRTIPHHEWQGRLPPGSSCGRIQGYDAPAERPLPTAA